MTANCGFDEEELKQVFITLDKWNKIGRDGVTRELTDNDFSEEKINKLMAVLLALPQDCADYERIVASLSGKVDLSLLSGVERLIKLLQSNLDGEMKILFNPTLVRGMDYYSGPVFEITYGEYPFAIAGGGRYDGLIKRLFGVEVSSCGISFGLERIITILQDQERTLEEEQERIAYLVNPSDLSEGAVWHFDELAKAGKNVSLLTRRKKTGKQLKELQSNGFTHFIFYSGEGQETDLEIRPLGYS